MNGYVWDNGSGYLVGRSVLEICWISQDTLGYLIRISFSGYVEKRYPESPKISGDIPPSEDIPFALANTYHLSDLKELSEGRIPYPGQFANKLDYEQILLLQDLQINLKDVL
jgi:hypothetical protein